MNELIEKWLSNELNDEQTQKFMELMQQNPDLFAEAKVFANLKIAIRAYEKAQIMKMILEETETEEERKESKIGLAKTRFHTVLGEISASFYENLERWFTPLAYPAVARNDGGALKVISPVNGVYVEDGLVFELEKPLKNELFLLVKNALNQEVISMEIEANQSCFEVPLIPDDEKVDLNPGWYYWRLSHIDEGEATGTFFVNGDLNPFL